MKKTQIALIILAALASSSALADNSYIGATIGRSSVKINKSGIDQDLTAVGVTGLSSSVKEEDTAYSFLLGYQFNRNFALEASYVNLGEATYSASFTGGTAHAKIKTDGWTFSGLGIIPLNAKFSLYGRLGVILDSVKAPVDVAGTSGAASTTTDAHGTSPIFGIGGMFNLNEQLDLRAEATRYQKVGDKNKTGEGDINLFALTLTYKY